MKYTYYFVFLVIGCLGAYFGFNYNISEPIVEHDIQCITIIITIEESTEYEICSESNYLGEVIDNNLELLNAIFRGSTADIYGRLLVQLEGKMIESNEFFFIYVNGEYGQYGVDKQIIKEGYKYEFILQTY